MNKIEVPDRYNYIGIFLTLRCNLNCKYCINKHSDFKQRSEISVEKWIQLLNRLEINQDLSITLEGGEPSLHPGFYDIIRYTNHSIDILSNLSFDVSEFVDKVKPDWLNKGRNPSYKSIRASYHSQDPDELLEKATALQNAGFNIGLFALNLPEKLEQNMIMAEKSRKLKIYFFIKDFLGFRDDRLFGYFKYPGSIRGPKKNVICRTKELLVSPDGNVFRCHRDLYANETSIGSLLDNKFEINDTFRACSSFGDCSPCDVKIKTNRFLEMGSCSVEIKENL